MLKNARQSTRMTGMDQLVWDLTCDQDLFCIWAIALLEEPLKDDLLRKSLVYLIQTIPILHTKPITNICYGKWQFPKKDHVEDLVTQIKVSSDEAAEKQIQNIFHHPIDAQKMSMIRILTIDGPHKHYFVVQVHHLVVDGEGLKRICVQFAEIYHNLYNDENWKPSGMLDPCRSWGQIAKRFTMRQWALVLWAYIMNACQVIKALITQKATYKIIGDFEDNQNPAPSVHQYFEKIIIDREIMSQVKTFTKKHQVTVNDVLMTSLSLATMKWNNARGDDRNWLKFGYTGNLRRWWGEPGGTFGNFSVVLIYDENHRNLTTPSIALANIKLKVDKMKKRIGLDGFLILLQLKFVPYSLIRRFTLSVKAHLFAFLKKSHAMTNIGFMYEEAGDFGHTQAKEYSLLAPTFPGGCIVYTISTYKNTTTVYLGSSEPYLTKASAKKFLGLWKQAILELLSA